MSLGDVQSETGLSSSLLSVRLDDRAEQHGREVTCPGAFEAGRIQTSGIFSAAGRLSKHQGRSHK